jgi:hypothetical protein
MKLPLLVSTRLRAGHLLTAALVTGGILSAQGVAPAPAPKDADVTVLPEFKVDTGRHIDEYVASEAISGTRTGAKILELPFGVEVLTKEFIEDFRLYEQDEQMRFTRLRAPADA